MCQLVHQLMNAKVFWPKVCTLDVSCKGHPAPTSFSGLHILDILRAVQVTQQAMAFMVEHTTGIICTAMPPADLDRLQLPLMVPTQENDEAMRTAFTVTVDARCLTGTLPLSQCTSALLHAAGQHCCFETAPEGSLSVWCVLIAWSQC